MGAPCFGLRCRGGSVWGHPNPPASLGAEGTAEAGARRGMLRGAARRSLSLSCGRSPAGCAEPLTRVGAPFGGVFLSPLPHKPLGNTPARCHGRLCEGSGAAREPRPEGWRAARRDRRRLCLGPPPPWRAASSRGGDPRRGSGRPFPAPLPDGTEPGRAPPPLGPYSPATPGSLGGGAARPPGLPPRRRGRHQGHWQAGRHGAGDPRWRFGTASRSRCLVGEIPRGRPYAARWLAWPGWRAKPSIRPGGRSGLALRGAGAGCAPWRAAALPRRQRWGGRPAERRSPWPRGCRDAVRETVLRGSEATRGRRERARERREPRSALWPKAPAPWQRQAAVGAPVKGGWGRRDVPLPGLCLCKGRVTPADLPLKNRFCRRVTNCLEVSEELWGECTRWVPDAHGGNERTNVPRW